jgi:hypothetical protein
MLGLKTPICRTLITLPGSVSNEPTGLPFLIWISVAKQKDRRGLVIPAGGETLPTTLSDATVRPAGWPIPENGLPQVPDC